MNIFTWINQKIFKNYSDWSLILPEFSQMNGLNLDDIKREITWTQKGYRYFFEIIPHDKNKNCTSMKIYRASEKSVHLYLTLDNKKYYMENISYNQAMQVLLDFVTEGKIPEKNQYFLAPDRTEIVQNAFVELVKLLIKDDEKADIFLQKTKIKNIENTTPAWIKLYKYLVKSKKAYDLDWKLDKEDFADAVKTLIKNDSELHFDESWLDENDDIVKWVITVNNAWNTHVLAEFDIQSDCYILMILTKKEFTQAKKLAETMLQKIKTFENKK